MIPVLIAAGALGMVIGWRLSVSGKISIWVSSPVLFLAIGSAALATGRVSLSPKVNPWLAAIAGAGAGATAVFVWVASRWEVFDRHVAELYARRTGLPLPAAILLAAGITAPGEEVFWRGLAQWRFAEGLGWPKAVLVVLGASVACYLASQSLPIIAGAVVAGAVWGGLALWTHGVLASILCHVVWTALMVGVPPGRTARLAAHAHAGNADADADAATAGRAPAGP
jgi:membrane protease YdiL (CAAX protease family)